MIGYLLLFYILASKIQEESNLPKDDYIVAYQEFCNSNNKELSVELAEDLEVRLMDSRKIQQIQILGLCLGWLPTFLFSLATSFRNVR